MEKHIGRELESHNGIDMSELLLITLFLEFLNELC